MTCESEKWIIGYLVLVAVVCTIRLFILTGTRDTDAAEKRQQSSERQYREKRHQYNSTIISNYDVINKTTMI